MTKTTFEEELARHGQLWYTSRGDSMRPLIREKRDLLLIEPVRGRLRRLDIPLYRRDSGQYVLHRVLRVRREDYVLCGDNRWRRETGIEDRHILGVLTALVRDGKTISLNCWQCRLYAHLWCDFFWVRAPLLMARGVFRRCRS